MLLRITIDQGIRLVYFIYVREQYEKRIMDVPLPYKS